MTDKSHDSDNEKDADADQENDLEQEQDQGGDGKEGGKYVRYTSEQIDVLERVYKDCPKPSAAKRVQLIKEYPVLANVEPKQIKVWFQNRRYNRRSFILECCFMEIVG